MDKENEVAAPEAEKAEMTEMVDTLASELNLKKEPEVDPKAEPEVELKVAPVVTVEPAEEPKVEAKVEPAVEPERKAGDPPASWRKEAKAKWAELPQWAKDEVLKRDEEGIAGVRSLKQAADVGNGFHKVIAPYLPVIQQQQLNPYQLVKDYMEAHRLLAFGTAKQKVDVVRKLLQDFSVPTEGLVGPAPEPAHVEPAVKALQDRLEALQSDVTRTRTAQTEADKGRLEAEVVAFAKDPAHSFFDEVATDIAQLIEGGACKTLQEAYDTAVARNPAVRQKVIDKAITDKRSADAKAAAERTAAARRSTAANVRSSTKSKSPTAPKGSMEDTLRETAEKLFSTT